MKWLHRLFGGRRKPSTVGLATGEKLPCKKCGGMILPITAKKTRGLCMPCATGRRQQTSPRQRLKQAIESLKRPTGDVVTDSLHKAILRERYASTKLRGLSRDLISRNHKVRNRAIEATLKHARWGDDRGLRALEKAISYMAEIEDLDDDSKLLAFQLMSQHSIVERKLLETALGKSNKSSSRTRKKAEKHLLYAGEEYRLTNDVDVFFRTVAEKGKAALKFHRADERKMRETLPVVGDKYIPESAFSESIFDSWYICAECKRALRRAFDVTPACGSCNTPKLILIVNNVESVISEEDPGYIRDYLKARADQWWSAQSFKGAMCDRCGIELPRGDGFLYKMDLVCMKCFSKLDILSDIESEHMSFELIGILRRARKYKKTGIAEVF